ncbi:hypothetical protein GQ457_06G017740 [Hibiscus cannabinus]
MCIVDYSVTNGFCGCGDKCPVWTAWKNTENIGRRFFGCPNFKTKNCYFVLWIDEILPKRARSLIYQLKNENDELCHSNGSIENGCVEKIKSEMDEMKKKMFITVETYERRNKNATFDVVENAENLLPDKFSFH